AAVAAILVTALLAYYLIPGTAEEMLLARAGDEVEQVSLADGSSILLRPHSAAYERPSGSSDYVVRLEGEAYFDVVTKPDRSFGVETAHGAVRVLGTAFSVRTWGGRTEVFLERGALSVEHARSLESAVLSPGMAALLEERGITVSDDGDAAEYRDWIRGELTFVERPARRVVAELAHHFDLSIDLQEPLANETITGSLTLDSAEAALSELALVLGAEISGSREAGFVVRAR
ncbi:MAG: FecR family protein, partial [Bacteroidota bacterium]